MCFIEKFAVVFFFVFSILFSYAGNLRLNACNLYSKNNLSEDNDSVKKTNLIRVNLVSDNDNFLLGLKDIVHLKDGNDFGFTFSLGTNISYIRPNDKFSLNFAKELYSFQVRNSHGIPIIANNFELKKSYFVLRQIDVSRLSFSYTHGSKFYCQILCGLDFRSRDSKGNLSLIKFQNFGHKNILNIRNFYYVSPEAAPKLNGTVVVPAYDKENLPEKITPVSFIIDIAGGYTQKYFSNKIDVDIKYGSFISTESTAFFGQNSFVYLKPVLKAYFGRKLKYIPLISEDIRLYANANTVNKNFSYIQGIGFALKFKFFKKDFMPSALINIPFGRMDFHYVNDLNSIVRIGLTLDI